MESRVIYLVFIFTLWDMITRRLLLLIERETLYIQVAPHDEAIKREMRWVSDPRLEAFTRGSERNYYWW